MSMKIRENPIAWIMNNPLTALQFRTHNRPKISKETLLGQR